MFKGKAAARRISSGRGLLSLLGQRSESSLDQSQTKVVTISGLLVHVK